MGESEVSQEDSLRVRVLWKTDSRANRSAIFFVRNTNASERSCALVPSANLGEAQQSNSGW